MAQLLKNILEGAKQILVLFPEDEYIRPGKNGFQRDNRSLQGDSKQVIQDINRTLKKHGQIHYR